MRSPSPAWVRKAALLALGLLGSGCTTSLSFNAVEERTVPGETGGHTITGADVSDQGSGASSSVFGPGGHQISRAAIGGNYARRTDTSGPTFQMKTGLYKKASQ